MKDSSHPARVLFSQHCHSIESQTTRLTHQRSHTPPDSHTHRLTHHTPHSRSRTHTHTPPRPCPPRQRATQRDTPPHTHTHTHTHTHHPHRHGGPQGGTALHTQTNKNIPLESHMGCVTANQM